MAVSTLFSVNILKHRFESSQQLPMQMLITKVQVWSAINNPMQPVIIQSKKCMPYGRNPVLLHLPFAIFPSASVVAKYLRLCLQIPTISEMRSTGYCGIIVSFCLM